MTLSNMRAGTLSQSLMNFQQLEQSLTHNRCSVKICESIAKRIVIPFFGLPFHVPKAIAFYLNLSND